MTRVAVIAAVLILFPSVANAQEGPIDPCVLNPNGERCSVGGGDPPPATPEDPPNYWSEWYVSGICPDGLIRWQRHLRDGSTGEPIEPPVIDAYCVRSPGEDDAARGWDALTSDSRVLALPSWTSNPDPDINGKGSLTGLDTWIWYEGDTWVEPIFLTWVEPGPIAAADVAFELEARAWTDSIVWDTGDGAQYTSVATTYDSAPALRSSEEAPLHTHVYTTRSETAGYADGYPATVTIRWIGEWRWRTAGGTWTGWLPINGQYVSSTTQAMPVISVVGELRG